MAKKEEKKMRVRYIKGDPAAGVDDWERECFRIEVWDENNQSWGLDTEYPCVSCAEFPDKNGERTYVKWEIAKKICDYLRLGYAVCYAGEVSE